jgi:hypothetical protein
MDGNRSRVASNDMAPQLIVAVYVLAIVGFVLYSTFEVFGGNLASTRLGR